MSLLALGQQRGGPCLGGFLEPWVKPLKLAFDNDSGRRTVDRGLILFRWSMVIALGGGWLIQ